MNSEITTTLDKIHHEFDLSKNKAFLIFLGFIGSYYLAYIILLVKVIIKTGSYLY
jgi:hypothetical protein